MKKLFCYNLEKLSNPHKNKFRKDLLGHNDASHNGKYKYKRDGLLQRIWNKKPVRSVVIVKEVDAKEVIKILKKWNVQYVVYIVHEEL